MKQDAVIEEVQGLGEIARRFGIRLVLRFGSTVTGHTHGRSDVDLAVQLPSAGVSLQTVLEIQAALQPLFSGCEVDLAILNRADPLFLKKILDACRLLYGAPQDLARLRLYAFKAYQDFRPYLEMERRYVAARLAGLMAEPAQP
jgi:predicted nucleotidyltransferase